MVGNVDYFKAYENLHVHRLMLEDDARNNAYYQAVMENAELFRGKTVLDIGSGTGILSLFCAKAGASLVYAVEAASNMIPVLKGNIAANGYNDTIKVVEGRAEDLSELVHLKADDIDIIISEWMGFFLLHEGMLESVISARQFLKKDGFIFPDKCSIKAALCELPQFYSKWNNFYGLDMSFFSQQLRFACQTEPQICRVPEDSLISDPFELFSFNVKDVTKEELTLLTKELVVPAKREGLYQGLCIWFDVNFPHLVAENEIVLSTSPFVKETHWKQTVIVLGEEVPLEEKEPIGFEISLKKEGSRFYQIEYSIKDPNSLAHTVPCNCYEMKCQIIQKFLEEQQDEELSDNDDFSDSEDKAAS